VSIQPIRQPPCYPMVAALRDGLEGVVFGKREVVNLAITTVLARGHLLIQDVPGVGKTTLAHALAQGIAGRFARIQFTADLLPGDITGVQVFDRKTSSFSFRPGPIFANVVLGDEINRAPPRTQSALLEAMEERMVTVDGVSRQVPDPFVVVATQNPYDFEGTYPLPESQLDRFLMRISIGYPDRESEVAIMRQKALEKPQNKVQWSESNLQEVFAAVESVQIADTVEQYLLDVVRATRSDHRLRRGVSPRGTQALFRAVRAYALVQGRGFAIPDDVWTLAVPVLGHRVLPRSGRSPAGDGGRNAVEEILRDLPVPG